jgi:hypothetical protein
LGINNLDKLTTFSIPLNNFSGVMPALSTIASGINVNVGYNPNLVTPSEKAPNWQYYSNFKTASETDYDMERISTTDKYSKITPQDGDFMTLNKDIDGDGHADINLTYNNSGHPDYNIDTNGDNIADLKIVIHEDYLVSSIFQTFNSANTLTSTDGTNIFIGWIPQNFMAANGMNSTDYKVGPSPYYMIAKTNGALVDRLDGKSPTILILTDCINVDLNHDGVPDKNIDVNNDGIAEYNINANICKTPDSLPTPSAS